MNRPAQHASTGIVLACALALAACGGNVSAQRSATVAAEGATTIRIIQDAGKLDVVGQSGAGSINATGTAYAASASQLDRIQFATSRVGTSIVLEAKALGVANSHFDVVLTVPDGLAVTVDSGAGDLDLRNLAAVDVTLGAGNVDIRSIRQDVTVTSIGAGNLKVADVQGDLDVRNLGAGNIDVNGVAGSVEVRQVGVGNVTVRNVGGDFTAGGVGVGNITYSDIRGTVRVP